MKLKVAKVDMWLAGIADKPGSLAKKLSAISPSRANLQFVLARRSPERPGRGVVFVSGLKTAAQTRAAKKAGFRKSKSLHALQVQGPNRAGIGAKLTAALADAGVDLRGLSAAVVGKDFVLHLALDSAAAARKAARVLKAV
ncbi:MAG TPA: ACT domain-containing protein [Phycisphaerae bacterium]|nr:ACT domain-containing protein [Phycisphaerae bacterium]